MAFIASGRLSVISSTRPRVSVRTAFSAIGGRRTRRRRVPAPTLRTGHRRDGPAIAWPQMFTGIVEELGHVDRARRRPAPHRLHHGARRRRARRIDRRQRLLPHCRRVGRRRWDADVSDETLEAHEPRRPAARRRRSTSSARSGCPTASAGTSCRATSTASARSSTRRPTCACARPDLLRYVVEKGSITVDGISLTVVDALDDGFTVAVIPHTTDVTTLAHKGAGRPRQPGGRRHRQVRRTAPRLEGSMCMTGLARIEDAVAAIGRGEIVVVVDDEDRENEGDLIMAAEFATPEYIAFFLQHTSGRHLRHRDVRAGPPARPRPDGAAEHRDPAHGVPRHRRLPPRHDDGDLGRRPGGDDPRPRRPGHQARRPAAPGPHLPAGGPRGRRAEARRAHRGGDRPGPHGWLRARRRAVRDRQRRQARDGQAPRAGGVLRPSTAC